jgi:peptidoglycan/xylan/chitin deacetylase (PgdA/CDA1 family)
MRREGAGERLAGNARSHLPAVPILMYHSVASTAAPRFSRYVVNPEIFAEHMNHLAGEGYQPITAGQLARQQCAGGFPGRPVVLTFDDAYTDFEDTALPILRSHNFPATLYVPTAFVGGTALWLRDCGEADRKILSWRALTDIHREGIEVASHSHTHPQLDRVPGTVVNDELRRSRQLLEDNLGVPIEGFAYPFGYWTRGVRSRVADAGYTYACSVSELAAAAEDGLFTLPRITVAGGTSVLVLSRLLAAVPGLLTRRASEAKRLAWLGVRHITALGGDPQSGRLP